MLNRLECRFVLATSVYARLTACILRLATVSDVIWLAADHTMIAGLPPLPALHVRTNHIQGKSLTQEVNC